MNIRKTHTILLAVGIALIIMTAPTVATPQEVTQSYNEIIITVTESKKTTDTATHPLRIDRGFSIPQDAVYNSKIVSKIDTDGSGTINQTELGNAGQQYLNNKINQTELGITGQAYLKSK